MDNFESLNNIEEPMNTAPEEVQKIIKLVLTLEKDRLYKKNRRTINDDVLTIIKEVIQ
jgi:hypothetical protein